MDKTRVDTNPDLLKCENEFYVNQSQTKSLLITKSALKSAITPAVDPSKFKTEKISSNVLSRAKHFMAQTKDDDNIGDKCDLVDESAEEVDDGQQVIEMNLLLFENKNTSKTGIISEDESKSDDSDDETEDSEQDSKDSESENERTSE